MAKEKKEVVDDRIERLKKIREKTNKDLKSLSEQSEIYNPSHYFDYGNVMLNLITGGNWKLGQPNNISTMFIGNKDSGKSLLCLMLIKSSVDAGYIVYYFETEGAISLDKMKEFGINTDFVVPIPTTEYDHLIGLKFYVLDLLKNEKLKDKSIFVYDSIAMVLDSEKFEKNKKEDETKTMGKGSQEANDFFKAVIQRANLQHKPQIFVNRTYKNFSVDGVANMKYATEEQKETIGGGSASQFGVSSILRIKKDIIYIKAKVYDELTGKEKEIKKPVSNKFTITSARKNRIVKPGMDIYFVVDDKRGLLKYSGLPPYAQDLGYLEKVRGGWKIKNNETIFKTPQQIPDSEWERLLNIEGLGEALNNQFSFGKLYGNDNTAGFDIDDENGEFECDDSDENNDE